jgi:polyphosphate kinase
LSGVVRREPVDDVFAESAAADERSERRARNDLDRGDPDPGERNRKRERPVDAGADLAFAHPEAAGGVPDGGGDAPQAEVGVDRDRRDCQQREGQERRREADAEQRQREGEDREARHDARRRDRGERRPAQPRRARRERPERHTDGERRSEGRGGERDVIAEVEREIEHRRADLEIRRRPAKPCRRMIVPPESVSSVPSLDDPSLFYSRELSWLEFNDRVLEEAVDARNPLLERLKFTAIFSTNLDEYFMIRVAALKQQIAAEVHKRSNDGRLPAEQLAAISRRLRHSLARFTGLLRDELFPALEREGIAIRRYADLSAGERESLERLFEERVFPVLTPLAVDQGHPFPYISNLSLSLGVELYERTDEGLAMRFARVKVPQSLPRLIPIDAPPGAAHFVMLEDVIAHNLGALFPGLEIRAAYCFRVTRDADLDLQEDEADDLLRAIESELRKRRFGEPVRLEVEASMPPHLRAMLLDALALREVDLYAIDGMLGTSDLWALVNLDRPELHDPPFTPAIPKRLLGETDIFAVIREGDLLLHHPYDSFDPVVQFVRQAANDPQVLAIKQTLYRTSGDSPVVNALVEAAENGKQVAALIELKARFDEENNIHWARNLERVGAHVVYGFPGLKVHAKVTLVVRDEPDGIRRYVHFGTGNYNDKTARVYTDLSLFTCRPDLGADVTHLFNSLTGFSKPRRYERLLVAPTTLRSGFDELIARETEHARAGRPSGIVAKLNAISDRSTVQALYRASQAGVPIELIVRGMCELRPGIPGVSETIRVRSIVGRFLEHSRIFCFTNGGEREVYVGSADWMGRNLDRRVETMVPVLDPAIRETIETGIIDVLRRDTAKTRWLQPDGTYVRCDPGPAPFSAQEALLRAASVVAE